MRDAATYSGRPDTFRDPVTLLLLKDKRTFARKFVTTRLCFARLDLNGDFKFQTQHRLLLVLGSGFRSQFQRRTLRPGVIGDLRHFRLRHVKMIAP